MKGTWDYVLVLQIPVICNYLDFLKKLKTVKGYVDIT